MIPTNNPMYPILATKDIFLTLKAKYQNEVRYFTHFNTLYNSLLEMFTWDNLPNTIPKRFLEGFLHTTGQVFVAKINGELYACNGTLSGEVDAYGMGTNCVAVTPIGEAQGKRGTEIAYGINNDTASPDTLTYWISHLLGETDKSLQTNIMYSRYLPIPKVNDTKDKQAFDEILDKLKDGELRAFASKNILSELDNNGAETFEITDVERSDKIQHLSRLYDELFKRFYNVYGQPLQTQNKSSQTLSDEIHGMDSVSFIIPLQMYKCRLALADEINRIFGTDITVRFSEAWQYEYNAFVYRDGGFEGANVEELDKTDLNQSEIINTEQDKTEQDGTNQNKSEQDGTNQNKSEQAEEIDTTIDESDDIVKNVLENGEVEITDKPAIEDVKEGNEDV